MSKTYIPKQLREFVRTRAEECCEYCRIPEVLQQVSYHVDHITPEKQKGPTVESNLALACPDCNYRKGYSVGWYDDDKQVLVRLYRPRTDKWGEHFLLLPSGIIKARTREGEVTIKLLQINEIGGVIFRNVAISQGLIQPST